MNFLSKQPKRIISYTSIGIDQSRLFIVVQSNGHKQIRSIQNLSQLHVFNLSCSRLQRSNGKTYVPGPSLVVESKPKTQTHILATIAPSNAVEILQFMVAKINRPRTCVSDGFFLLRPNLVSHVLHCVPRSYRSKVVKCTNSQLVVFNRERFFCAVEIM